MRPLARSGHSLHHRAEALAEALPPLLVSAERVASTVAAGVHGRRRPGPGESFWQFRRYQWGDAAATIDWRRSAKSDHHFVRETEWTGAQTVWLWRDGSASMNFRSRPLLSDKRHRASLLVLALASLLVRAGERVALIGGGAVPATGRAVLGRMAASLEATGAGSSLPPSEPLPRHARAVLVGDFLAPLDAVDDVVGRLSKQGIQGHLLQVLDPAEETLPYRGRIHFEGPENEGGLLVGRAESLKGDYTRALSRHRAGLEALARGRGWTFATHSTDIAPETALMALYQVLEG